jgi:hypothetical protein
VTAITNQSAYTEELTRSLLVVSPLRARGGRGGADRIPFLFDPADSTGRRNATSARFGGCDAAAKTNASGWCAGGKAAAVCAADRARVSNAEACRLVGVNRKTGTRWRHGRSVLNSAGEVLHYPPVTITPDKPRSRRYLSEQERVLIADLLARGTRSVRSPGSFTARHRRSAGRFGVTPAWMAAIARITRSGRPGSGRVARVSGS